MKYFAFYTLFFEIITISSAGQVPVKIGIAGLSHSHVIPLLRNLDEMLEKTMPDGVITFTSIFEHLAVVEACAPRGIDVNPFAFFAAAVKGDIRVEPTDLSSLEINLTVVEILEAARLSSETGMQVILDR